jgi:AhpC/TSA family
MAGPFKITIMKISGYAALAAAMYFSLHASEQKWMAPSSRTRRSSQRSRKRMERCKALGLSTSRSYPKTHSEPPLLRADSTTGGYNRRLEINGGNKRMALKVGDVAPDFEVPAVTGKDKSKLKLSDFRGKQNVVIAFYPLDWTPV